MPTVNDRPSGTTRSADYKSFLKRLALAGYAPVSKPDGMMLMKSGRAVARVLRNGRFAAVAITATSSPRPAGPDRARVMQSASKPRVLRVGLKSTVPQIKAAIDAEVGGTRSKPLATKGARAVSQGSRARGSRPGTKTRPLNPTSRRSGSKTLAKKAAPMSPGSRRGMTLSRATPSKSNEWTGPGPDPSLAPKPLSPSKEAHGLQAKRWKTPSQIGLHRPLGSMD